MLRDRTVQSLLQPLLLGFCAATATLLGETLVLAVGEGHHLAELASDGEALRLWGRYIAAFALLALGASVLTLPLAWGGERPRRLRSLLLVGVMFAPVLWGTLAMRSGVLDVLGRPSIRIVLGLFVGCAALWVGFAVLARRTGPYRLTLALACAGLLAAPAAATFGVQSLPSELVGPTGILTLLAIAAAGLLAGVPLAFGLGSWRTPAAVGAVLALLFGALLVSAPRWRQALPPAGERVASGTSVLMIVADTLRADAAADPELAPNLASFAERSIVFERAYSAAPWTIPSFASMLTSTLPSAHGAGRTDPALGHKHGLRATAYSLAEAFQGAGYSTLAVLSNPTLSPRYGLDRGFDQYENLLSPQWYHPVAFGLRHRRLPRWLMPRELAYMRAPAQTRRILSAIDRARTRSAPFFVLGHYMDPHEPYAAPERFQRREEGLQEVERAYRAEVRYFDAELGRLLEGLRERGLADELLIVFVSDHGQELTEERTDLDFLHGHTLFEEQIHVPLIVRLPGASGGERIAEPVSLVDVAPTLLRRAGLEVPDSFRGRDLLEGVRADGSRVVFAEGMIAPPEQRAAVRGSQKVLSRGDPREAVLERYDLSADPRERAPVDAGEAERFAPLEAALRRHLAESRPEDGEDSSEGVVADPALRQQLEALGYAE